MSNNPNDKKDIKDASLLSAAIVSAPAIGGTAYGLREMMKQRQFRPPRETSFASAARRIQGFAYGTGPDTAQLFHDTGFLRTDSGGEVARNAWNLAMSSSGEPPGQLLNFTHDMNALPPGNVFAAIEQTVQRNTSLYMRRVASKFRRNVSAFQRHQQLTGKLPNLIRAENFKFPSAFQNSGLPTNLQPTFDRITSSLGWGKADWYSRAGWAERGFGMYKLSFRSGDNEFQMSLPIAKNGRLAEGLTQSSMRIAPDVAIFDPHSGKITERLSRHEFMLRDFEQSILPDIKSGKLKTSWAIQNAIDEMYERNIYSLQNIPNLPGNLASQGWESYANVRSKAVDIRILANKRTPKAGEAYSSVFRAPDSREFTAAMQAGDFFPATSPGNLAEGRVSTYDPRKWSMTPTAEDLSRRITQANREWRATPAAVDEMMKTKWSIFETQAWRQEMGPNAAPHFRTLYVNPDKRGSFLDKFGIGEGELAIHGTAGNKRALETFRAATPVRLKRVREDIQSLIDGGDIKFGEYLGETVEGTPFTFQPGMKLTGMEKFATAGSGQFFSLYYDEVVRAAEHSKGFMGAKGMRRLMGSDQFFQAQKDVAMATKNSMLSSGFDMIVNMDELKKNPARHNTQMITELWNLLDTMRDRDFVRRNVKLRAFMSNPTGAAGIFEKYATKAVAGGTAYSHQTFVENLMRFALVEGQLSPKEFGSVFGAVPHVLGKEGVRTAYNNLALNQFSFRHLREMHKGFTGGIAQTVFGGTKEDTGAGSLGSIEPRAFDILQGGHYGSLGGDIADDFMKRLAISNPETFMTHEALSKTLLSAQGKLPASGNIWDVAMKGYKPEEFQEFIEKGGGFVKAPGMPDIFVPGPNAAPSMSSFNTPSDSVVRGKLANIYHDYTRSMAKFEDAGARTNAFNSFLGDIAKEHAPAGKGAGSFLRGKGILGSRFLTGVTEAAGQRTSSPFTVGLPEHQAMSMFDELRATGAMHEDIEAMKQAFLEGKTIGGVVSRHPFIGQHSIQPVNFQILRGVSDPVMTLPSIAANIRLAGEEKANPIRLSPLVGMAGDLDADIYSAHLVTPDLSQKIVNQFTNASNEATEAYMQHMVRAQLIKAKAAGGGAGELTTGMKTIAAAKKLATAQEWVGRLSTELSSAREAVGANLSGQQAADARFLLEWLEQVPISGKHLKDKDIIEERMSSFFETIETSLRTRNPEYMKSAVEGVLRNSDSVTKRLLTEDIHIAEGADQIRQITGKQFRDFLPGINLAKSVDDIMSSLSLADSTGATEAAKFAAARRTVTQSTLNKYMDKMGVLLSRKEGLMASVSSAAIAAKNFLGQAGAALIKNKRAVGFGFAGSLALATILSSPDDTIGPGSGFNEARIDRNPGRAKDRMETIPPASQSLGAPTVPSMIANRSMIAPGSDSVRMSVKARSQGRVNAGHLGNRASMAAGRNANININVRDDSSSMNPHILANKLYG
jgi:hypothetical protein